MPSSATADGAQYPDKGPGQAFLADATIDGTAEHVISLDAGGLVDAVFVGVSLVILGDQTGGLVCTEILQDQDAQLAINQDEFRLGHAALDRRHGFDQADFMERGDNLLVLAGAHPPIRAAFAGRQSIQRDPI